MNHVASNSAFTLIKMVHVEMLHLTLDKTTGPETKAVLPTKLHLTNILCCQMLRLPYHNM